uniref:Uncharacterized protein n=1 Tax=viral metagenome TaxID=1070528 RepID=A0A6C0LRG1_9ZZZZ
MENKQDIEINDVGNEMKDDIEKNYLINDDMIFPPATIDSKLISLQKNAVEFISSVILKHEKFFYDLVNKDLLSELESLLGTTDQVILDMITTTTNDFYNKLYFDVQHKNDMEIVKWINEMAILGGYGAHILLDKLIRLTISIHFDIIREELDISNYKKYNDSLHKQLSYLLVNINFLHIFSKAPDDETEFFCVPENSSPFKIIIDKPIKK